MRPNPVVIFYPPQNFIAAPAIQLRQEIRDGLAVGIKAFLINFQEVEFINNDAIDVLGMILEDVESFGGLLFLCSLSEAVNLALELTETIQVFTTFVDQNEFQEKVLGN